MIVTAKNRIPFLWQLGIAAPWGVLRFKYMVMGAVFIFSLKKFIENPAGITFIMSIPTMLSLAVNPISSFMSDRIWTRWGRRKPFVVPSMLGVVLAFVIMPLAPNIWVLMAAYFLYQISHDFGLGATDTIKQEVVPPKQRGTAAAIGTWLQNIFNLGFYLIALGRFDDYKFYAGFPITGEESIYWGISAAILMMALLMMLGVKETEQPSKFRGQRFTIRNFLGGLLNRNLWPVYLLITGWSVANAGLGALGALLYTEQWGFSKQEMGINVAVGSTLNIFIIALIGMFADKLPRMKTFELLLFISIFIELSFYCYVEFVLFDKTPTLPEVILFGEIGSIAGILLGMLYLPLVYDYIPRNEMGTFSAGSVLVGKLVQIITLNGVGVFVTAYSMFFMPPGGEMTRITLDERSTAAEVRQLLASEDPAFAEEDAVSIEPWFATNAAFENAHSFEIRRKNEASMDINREMEKINSQLASILAKKSNAEAERERARIAGDAEIEAAATAEIEQFNVAAAPLEAEIAALKAQLQAEADRFQQTVGNSLADELMAHGSQIAAAHTEPATLLKYPLQARPDSDDVARTLNQMRLIRPDLIDLSITVEELDFHLLASVGGDPMSTEAVQSFTDDLYRLGAPRIGEPLGSALEPPIVSRAESIVLELKTLEDPTNNYISPITKVIYRIWDVFGDAPAPLRRVWATARSLRNAQSSAQVGAWDISVESEHRIRLQAVYLGEPDPYDPDTISANHQAAIGAIQSKFEASPERADEATDLYLRALDAAAQNKITIPTPVLDSRFAKPKYDYMSGYLWMIIMSSVGLLICLLFTRRERKGLIRKRGREEAEAEEAAEAQAAIDREASNEAPEAAHKIYRPGYVPHKIAMTAFGLGLIALGLLQVGPNLKLVLTGEPTTAFASKVVKERIGGSQETLLTDADIEKAAERFDRSYVFWNYFTFEDGNGTQHEVRSLTGKQLEPQYQLFDKDGLPTAILIYYNPENPEEFVIPLSYSTWFLGGLLILFGLIGTYFGGVLLYYARKPIEMPIVKPKDAPAAA